MRALDLQTQGLNYTDLATNELMVHFTISERVYMNQAFKERVITAESGHSCDMHMSKLQLEGAGQGMSTEVGTHSEQVCCSPQSAESLL